MHFNIIGESANWVLNAFIYPREWLREPRLWLYVIGAIGSAPALLMFVTETLPSVSGILPKLRRNFTRCCFASYATDHSTNLGLQQDLTGLLVHQISQRCYLWCGKNRRLNFFVFFRDPARVSVTIRLPEPWVTSDCIINIHGGEAGQLAVAWNGSTSVAMLLLPDFNGAAAGKQAQVVDLPGTPRRSDPIER